MGHLSDETGEGVDAAVSATFIYKNGGTARFQTSCRVELACEGKIYGTKGIVYLENIKYLGLFYLNLELVICLF